MKRSPRMLGLVVSGVWMVLAGLRGDAQKAHIAPLQATLDVPLSTAKLHIGDPVFASVLVAWQGPDCFLKQGATVYGRVVDAQTRLKGMPESTMTLVFDRADCNGVSKSEAPLLLYALVDPTGLTEAVQIRDRSGLFGSTSARPTMNMGGGMTSPVILSPASLARNDMSVRGGEALPGAVKAGQVDGLGRTKMSVGTGQEGGSVLRSKDKNIVVHARSQLVLIAMPGAKTVAQPGGRAPVATAKEEPVEAAPAAAPVVVVPVDVTEVCAVDCSVALDGASDASAVTLAKADASVAMGRLGYSPQSHQELTEFDDEATVTYLSPEEVLLTFDPHHLRQRVADGWKRGTRRTVRAVLVDAQSHKVKRVMDWEVDGDGQYLWRAGPERVLVHMGGALHELGAGLKTISIFPAPGEVKWLTTSPSGDHIAMGLLRERHSQEVHERIAALSGMTPEEDMEVRLLDPARKLLVAKMDSSEKHAPVLSDDGEVLVQAVTPRRWRIVEESWDGKRSTVMTVNSDCGPGVSAPVSGALFVVGCASSGGQRWYRMVRMDGHTLVKSTASSAQVEQSASAGGAGTFAVRVVNTNVSTVTGGMLRASELTQETVDVYRVSDGRRVFSTQVETYPQSNENFALSEDGRQLAVLTGGDVALYGVSEGAVADK